MWLSVCLVVQKYPWRSWQRNWIKKRHQTTRKGTVFQADGNMWIKTWRQLMAYISGQDGNGSSGQEGMGSQWTRPEAEVTPETKRIFQYRPVKNYFCLVHLKLSTLVTFSPCLFLWLFKITSHCPWPIYFFWLISLLLKLYMTCYQNLVTEFWWII